MPPQGEKTTANSSDTQFRNHLRAVSFLWPSATFSLITSANAEHSSPTLLKHLLTKPCRAWSGAATDFRAKEKTRKENQTDPTNKQQHSNTAVQIAPLVQPIRDNLAPDVSQISLIMPTATRNKRCAD